jgi:hypothetical protein
MLRALILAFTLLSGAVHAATWSLLPETEVAVDVPWRGLTVVMRFPDVAGTIEFDERRPETARARIARMASGLMTSSSASASRSSSPGSAYSFIRKPIVPQFIP